MIAALDKKAVRHYTPKEFHSHLHAFNKLISDTADQHAPFRQAIKQPFGWFNASESFPVNHFVGVLARDGWRYMAIPPSTAYRHRQGHRLTGVPELDGVPRMQPQLRLELVADPVLVEQIENIQREFPQMLRADSPVTRKATQAAVEQIEDRIREQQKDKRTPEQIEDFLRGFNAESLMNKGLQAKTHEKLQAVIDAQPLGDPRKLASAVKQPTILFTAPLALMLRTTAKQLMRNRYTLYQHIFGGPSEYPDDGLFYIGITARDWKQRWAEHRASIKRGSKLLFHRKFRERMQHGPLTFVHHKIMGNFAKLAEVKEAEERAINFHWNLDERITNMIPGGDAGIRYLHEHGLLDRKVIPTPDVVERTLEKWIRENPRKGLPAPWVAKMWQDDEKAMSIICGRDGRLSQHQVRTIRDLAGDGITADEIMRRVGATNITQVKRVLAGKTYSRVR